MSYPHRYAAPGIEYGVASRLESLAKPIVMASVREPVSAKNSDAGGPVARRSSVPQADAGAATRSPEGLC